MRRRISLVLLTAVALVVSGCGTPEPETPPVAPPAVTALLKPYGYQLVSTRWDQGQPLTVYLICRGKYEKDAKGCRANFRENVSDDKPGVIMWGEKVYAFVGSNHGSNSKRRLSIEVPATPATPVGSEVVQLAPDLSVITWQDILKLQPDDVRYLLTGVMPEAARLYKAHGASKQVINRLHTVSIRHDKMKTIG
jgi:hypothetical protein